MLNYSMIVKWKQRQDHFDPTAKDIYFISPAQK